MGVAIMPSPWPANRCTTVPMNIAQAQNNHVPKPKASRSVINGHFDQVLIRVTHIKRRDRTHRAGTFDRALFHQYVMFVEMGLPIRKRLDGDKA